MQFVLIVSGLIHEIFAVLSKLDVISIGKYQNGAQKSPY